MHKLTQANAKVSATFCGRPLGVQGTWDYQIENLADFHRMCHEMWIDSRLDPTEILVPVEVAFEITRDVLMSPSSMYTHSSFGSFGGIGLGIDYLINRVTGSSVYINYPGKPRPDAQQSLPSDWVSLIVDEYE